MAEVTWEKSSVNARLTHGHTGRWKFLVGGFLILAAVVYLLLSGTLAGASYYITVDDLLGNADYSGKPVRMAGVVLGETIQYDAENLVLDFTIANVPMNYDNLADALHLAAINPDAARIHIHMENVVKPDLLQHEAQAILSGELGEDGIFYATELNLKCPTRFEEAQPGQEIAHPAA